MTLALRLAITTVIDQQQAMLSESGRQSATQILRPPSISWKETAEYWENSGNAGSRGRARHTCRNEWLVFLRVYRLTNSHYRTGCQAPLSILEAIVHSSDRAVWPLMLIHRPDFLGPSCDRIRDRCGVAHPCR